MSIARTYYDSPEVSDIDLMLAAVWADVAIKPLMKRWQFY